MRIDELTPFARVGILRAVIEIPAGSAEKRQFDPNEQTFPVDRRDGVPRVIAFLPYPANYGFIPGTRMNKVEGGDGDAVDLFVLCGSLRTGTILEVEPIGVIELLDAGERDDKLIAIPVDPALRTISVSDISELPLSAREILVLWLLNYDPKDGSQLVGIKGKKAALAMVERWTIRT